MIEPLIPGQPDRVVPIIVSALIRPIMKMKNLGGVFRALYREISL
jgi:hypothetical protein